MTISWETETAFFKRYVHSPKELDELYLKYYGITATELFRRFLPPDKTVKILEVGCGEGVVLELLRDMGYVHLTGCDVNQKALDVASAKGFNVVNENGLYLPDGWTDTYDVVISNVVLIHYHPLDLPKAIYEMIRVSRKYILIHEYYSPKWVEIRWNGERNCLWKTDYVTKFLDTELVNVDDDVMLYYNTAEESGNQDIVSRMKLK